MVEMQPILDSIFEGVKSGKPAEIPIYKEDFMPTATVDLKGFLKDMNNTLLALKFKDQLPNSKQAAKRGEMVEPSKKKNFNRTGNMFETKYYWWNLPNGKYEAEIEWKSQGVIPHAKGTTEVKFKLDLQARNVTPVEKLIDGKKKKMYRAPWEFRNEIVYIYKDCPAEWILKIPLIGDGAKKKIFEYFYEKEIEEHWTFAVEKMRGAIIKTIDKHFSG